jgi:hypothetical protein
MIEILRDPIWQFIGAILSVIAIGISIYIFIHQKNKKALSYRIVTDTELLTVNEEVKGKIKIVYDNVPVQDVHLIVIKIENNGNVPITSTDFEEPLTFLFGKTSQILSAEVTNVFPLTLKPIISIIDSNKIILEPILLNSKDNLTVKLLLAQFNKQITPEARIIGVGEVKKSEDRTRQIIFILAFTFGVAINGFIAILSDAFKGKTPDILGSLAYTVIIVSLVTLTAKIFANISLSRLKKKK